MLIYAESSYFDGQLDIKDNAYGVLKGHPITRQQYHQRFGNAIDTNSYKTTGNFAHTLYLDNNVITTGEGAGITAYDGAIVTATDNTISGASSGLDLVSVIHA